MRRRRVKSKKVKSVGYKDGLLEVELHSGSIVQYFDVTKAEHHSLIHSFSIGHTLEEIEKFHESEKIK